MKKIIKAITLFVIIAIFSEVSYAAEYLNSVEFNVDQIVPNFSISLSTPNINQFDIWLYNKETNTYWTPVDKLFFTKEITKNTFKVQSNTDNSIQLLFGDGVISINEAKRLLRETLAIQQVLLDMKLNLEEETH